MVAKPLVISKDRRRRVDGLASGRVVRLITAYI